MSAVFTYGIDVSQQLQLIAAPACQQSTPAVVISQQQPQPTTGMATQDVQVINDLDRGSDISPGLSLPKKMSKNYDEECIIMGDELSDLTINYAQELLKMQFVGFNSTLLQDKAA